VVSDETTNDWFKSITDIHKMEIDTFHLTNSANTWKEFHDILGGKNV
jgi:hypothetical protein